MKYPGQPKSAPSWYNDRGPSPIETAFENELEEMANLIEREQWFGDREKHSRYRVDFILKDARLIIELDGHNYHSTKEQLKNDAIRQRYLTRAGYSVIRFTGSEIHRNAANCVAEVRELYKERMQRAPAKYRAMYIDYNFLTQQIYETFKFYKNLYPKKLLNPTNLEEFIPHAIEWLHEKSFITAFVFMPKTDEDEDEAINSLDGKVINHHKGEVRINLFASTLYSAELGEHMESYSHLFDDFYLVADDPIYTTPFRSVLPIDFTRTANGKNTYDFLLGGKLLRKNNYETAFADTDLAKVKWQDIAYPIAAAMGITIGEL